MVVTVKNAVKRSSPKPQFTIVHIRSDDGPVEDLTAGEVGVQVDVRSQDEVLAVIFGTIAQQHQVLCRSDLEWVIRFSRPAIIFGMGRKADKARHNQ